MFAVSVNVVISCDACIIIIIIIVMIVIIIIIGLMGRHVPEFAFN